MFDPTAFENMKVVLEGALYDRDLDGEISILDRNDLMNLAKLSRHYEITFARHDANSIRCTLVLTADLENLASELHPLVRNEHLAGVNLHIVFTMEHENLQSLHEKIHNVLVGIWGSERTFTQTVSYDPLAQSNIINKEISLQFNRLILEEQIDDLVVMIDFMEDSLDKINQLL